MTDLTKPVRTVAERRAILPLLVELENAHMATVAVRGADFRTPYVHLLEGTHWAHETVTEFARMRLEVLPLSARGGIEIDYASATGSTAQTSI